MGAFEYQRRVPSAVASASTGSAAIGQAIDFTAAGTADPDPGDELTYAWTFGDGADGAGPQATHAYSTPGDHSWTLTVTDSTGLVASASGTVSVAAAATAPIAPALSLKAPKRAKVLRSRRLVVTALSDQAVTLRAKATLRIAGVRKPVALKTVKAALTASASGPVKLRLAVPRRALAAIRKALRSRRSVKATIEASARNGGGLEATASRRVRVVG